MSIDGVLLIAIPGIKKYLFAHGSTNSALFFPFLPSFFHIWILNQNLPSRMIYVLCVCVCVCARWCVCVCVHVCVCLLPSAIMCV